MTLQVWPSIYVYMYVLILIFKEIQNSCVYFKSDIWALYSLNSLSLFLKILFIYFLRGEGREKKRERNISVWLPVKQPPLGTWPETQACALTRD